MGAMKNQALCGQMGGLLLGVFSLLGVACSGSSDTRRIDARPSDTQPNDTQPSEARPADAGSTKAAHIGDKVFDESQVQSYYFTIADDEYARLMDFSTLLLTPFLVNDDRYVKVSLRVGDTDLPAVAVRFKGKYSIWGCVDFPLGQKASRIDPFFGNVDVCQRFSLKIDINRFDSSLRLDGLKKLNLHAMAADPSKMRERLGYALFREMNIPAPRVAHARVYINGKYQGLFAAVEDVDGRFTANRFPASGDGNLYRDVWPSSRLTESAAERGLRTNDDPGVANVSDFMAFADAVNAATEADFATKVGPYVDFDELARYIVVDRAIANSDGIMAFYSGPGWGPENGNYYWYNAGNGRFTLLPWDLDKAFWYPEPNFWSDNAANGPNIVPNWNVVTETCETYVCGFDAVRVVQGEVIPGSYNVSAVDCDPFLKLLRAHIYDRQKPIADAFVAGPFSDASVNAKIKTWRTQIADAMKDDPTIDSNQWQASVDALLADMPKFRSNLLKMMSGLIRQ
jgi:hypothetical protein